MTDKILLLINSEGDVNKINEIKKYISEKFDEQIKNEKLIIKETEDENSLKNISREFSNSSQDNMIIAVGGDGTVHEVVNSINFKNTSLCVLPNGTGNDLSHSLYGEKKFTEILDSLDFNRQRKIDLIKANDSYCVNVLSFGYDSIVLDKSLKIRKISKSVKSLSYILAIPLTINKVNPVNYEYEITTDQGKVIKGNGKYLLTALCNGSFFGKGFQPAPGAKIDDGVITFNHVDDMSILKLVTMLGKYKNGKHVNEVKQSHSYEVVKGKIKGLEGKFLGNMDGELYEFDEIDFHVVPKILRIVG